MYLVRALVGGFYNKQFQAEGTEFYVMNKLGHKWTDEFNRAKKEVVLTAKEQLGKWMEVIEELPDAVDAPQIVEKVVYVDRETDEVISEPKPEPKLAKKKTTKKKAVKKPEAVVEKPEVASENVITEE